ncbi:MAG: MmgE/PrpD family protein [Deltaproteobacteria bacterium]|nr:MmgE/PrpD family protein [Deltaproteobacteria bacterium]
MSEQQQPGLTLRLVRGLRGLRYQDIPAPALETARQCLLDFLGCALAGADDPLVDILVAEVAAREGASEASLIGRSERCTCTTAALINGSAAHALDFDDTHTTMVGHPSVPVLPAVLALAEVERCSGKQVIEAFVAGFELECRLGALLGGAQYAAGFHATGTLGTIGAAAAAARLLDLDEAQWLDAIGLAATQAAGLKASFGTMAKPLHAGRAAAVGLQSALLARRGFSAQHAILEIAQGFAAAHASPNVSTEVLDGLEGRFLVRDTLFKYHAACYLTHAAIEAAAELRRTRSLDVAAIGAVEVRVSPIPLGVCNIPEPVTGLEGKFSLRAAVALALLGEDTSALATYSDAKMREPGLVAVRDCVRVIADPELPPTQARVVVETPAGRFEAAADTGVPAADLAAQRARLAEKFRTLAAPSLGADRAQALCEMVARADELADIAALLELARAA